MTIPKNIESVDESAFSDCLSLGSIKTPNSIKALGRYVFYNNIDKGNNDLSELDYCVIN